MSKTFIKEIFSSIQGEGTHLGEMQIFVRFCKCNLSCKYCDTEFLAKNNTKEYTAKELAENILHNEVQTVSLTGGEPLLDVIFLKEFLPLIKKQKNIYLETNGTLPNELSAVLNYVDIIAADIKLESATKQKNKFDINDEFLNIAKKKEAALAKTKAKEYKEEAESLKCEYENIKKIMDESLQKMKELEEKIKLANENEVKELKKAEKLLEYLK